MDVQNATLYQTPQMIDLHWSDHEALFQAKPNVSSADRGEEGALWGEKEF